MTQCSLEGDKEAREGSCMDFLDFGVVEIEDTHSKNTDDGLQETQQRGEHRAMERKYN